MANELRNFKNFREEILKALGSTDDRDVENENNFKEALLDALGVEYVPADVRNFETFREKLVEGIANGGSGGGGDSDFDLGQISVINSISSTGDISIGYYTPDTYGTYKFVRMRYIDVSPGSQSVASTAVIYKGWITIIPDGEYSISADGIVDLYDEYGIYLVPENAIISVTDQL